MGQPTQRTSSKSETQPESSHHGEGDRASARRCSKHVNTFSKTHDTEALARRAEPATEEEAAAMERAERAGRRRAREFDPQVAQDR